MKEINFFLLTEVQPTALLFGVSRLWFGKPGLILSRSLTKFQPLGVGHCASPPSAKVPTGFSKTPSASFWPATNRLFLQRATSCDSDDPDNRKCGGVAARGPESVCLQATCQASNGDAAEEKAQVLGSILKMEHPPWEQGKLSLSPPEEVTEYRMTERKKRYLAYLESSHWYTLRNAAFERDNFKCTVCGSANDLVGHHLRYRKDLRLCKLHDVQTLCRKCHETFHAAQKQYRRENRKERRVLRFLLAADSKGRKRYKRDIGEIEHLKKLKRLRGTRDGSFVTRNGSTTYQPLL